MFKIKVSKRGQASFEFLVTYGWVFMVILIMFGALTYFDVLNPEKYIREECLFGTNIICEDWSIKRVDANNFDLILKLRNNMEKSIDVTNVSLYDRDSNEITDCNFNFSACVGLGSGKNCDLKATGCDKSMIINRKETLKISLDFKRTDGTVIHTINALLFAEVNS